MQELSTPAIAARLVGPGETVESLLSAAHVIRLRQCGPHIHVFGILGLSNYCRLACTYCGLRSQRSDLERYRLNSAAAVEAVREFNSSAPRKLDAVVLQSGEDNLLSVETVCEIITAVTRDLNVPVLVFPGERNLVECESMVRAGCTGFIVKFETSNVRLYEELRPRLTFEARISRIRELAALAGFVGTGNIVGLPGQSISDIAEDVDLARRLDPQLFVSSPFLPVPGTPLEGLAECSDTLLQRVVAMARITLEDPIIALSPASYTLDRQLLTTLLLGGANAIMVQITPMPERSKYQILPRRVELSSDDLWGVVRELENDPNPLNEVRAAKGDNG
jgi:biotin synthase